MARISLLFTLALVLAIGSVLAHPPSHKKTKKTLCPPTLGELQAFPFSEISKLIEKTAKSAPNTISFQTLFAVCRAYNDHLGAFDFHDVKDVVDKVHTKYSVMTQAMLRAQAFIGIEGELAVKLRKSYAAMAEGYVQVVEKVGAISAKYQFKADAKISLSDRAEVEKCVIKLSGSIRAFLKVISECDKKFSAKKTGFPTGPIGFLGSFVKQGLGHADKLIGLGGHGQVGAGIDVGAKGLAHAGVKLGARAGANVGGQGKAKVGGQGKVKVGVHGGAKAKVGGQGKVKVGVHGGAKAKVGGQGKVKVGVHGGAKAGGNIGGLFGGFLGFGGKAQFDAAGKAHVGGGNGFRPLSNPHKKHLN